MQTTTPRRQPKKEGPGPRDLPDIYFETTFGKFKCKPEDVKRNGGLCNKWRTNLLSRIEVGSSGMYMAWDGHRRPHCQEPRSRRSTLQKLAVARGVEVRNLSFQSKEPHVFEDDLIVVNEGMDLFGRVISDSVRCSLNMESTFDKLHAEMMSTPEVCDRGNVARGSGFASLNQKLVDKEVTAPQILSATTREDVLRMQAITSVIRSLCNELNIDEPFTNDQERNREWASYLCEHFDLPTLDQDCKPLNTIEGLTLGLSACNPPPLNGKKRKPILFGTHIDQFNCSMPGFNALFCYYEHFERDSRWYRVVVIGYSRACVSAFYRRKDEKNCLKSKLKAYVEYNICNGRGTAQPDVVPTGNGNLRSEIPFMDKVSGFYSAPATALRRIVQKDSKANLQTMCEIILPLGWLPTFSNVYPLLDEWSKSGLPESNNYTVTLINTLRDTHGSFVGGVGSRFQPSFNFSVPEKVIEEGLRTLLGVITDVNQGNITFGDRSLRQRMRSIQGLGDLGCLHVLHFATLAGVIHHTSFISSAHIAKGTNTWNSVVASYNLGEAVLNRMIADLADEIGAPACLIENALCEFCRDCDINLPFSPSACEESVALRRGQGDHPRWPDLFFKGQSIFFLRKRAHGDSSSVCGGKRKTPTAHTDLGEWEIVEKRQQSDGTFLDVVVVPARLCSDCERSWQDVSVSRRNSRIVKVTTKSKLRSECKTKTQQKVRVLKPVQHTGMGMHYGLEERLAEREEKRRKQAAGIMDQDTLDLIHDPTFRGGRVYRMDWLTNYPLQESGRKNGFRLVDVFGATVENLTYRHIDLRTTCLAILSEGGVMPQGKMKKGIKSYFRINSRSFIDNDKLDRGTVTQYTASINWHTMSALTVKDTPSGLSCNQLMRYSSRLAYYKTKADALRAVMIKTLVKVATQREKSQQDPTWARRLLPKKQLHAVLYENGDKSGNRDRLFGFLHFRRGKRVLSIPQDYSDLTRPWEDFPFCDYYLCND